MSLRLEKHRTDWWLTRKLVTLLISRLVNKMQEVGLPQMNMPGLNQMPRNLSLEHSLSLEFDAPTFNPAVSCPLHEVLLATEVSFSVTETESLVVFRGGKNLSELKLTRKEAHAFLEMMARKVKEAGWIDSVQWPEWLGVGDSSSNN